MFIKTLFVIVNTWKQPKCQPAGEWLNKPWCIHTMEQYAAMKSDP